MFRKKRVLEQKYIDKVLNSMKELHNKDDGYSKEEIERILDDDYDFEMNERRNLMLKKLKVVVVDDMKVLADNLTKIVSENENVEEVFTEYNGEDGLISILNNEPDVIFTDNQMPVKNGMELIEELQEYKFERKPKIILVTADNDIKLVTKSREIGFEIIYKPIQDNLVNQILDNIAYCDENEELKNIEVIEVKRDNIFKKIFKMLFKKTK